MPPMPPICCWGMPPICCWGMPPMPPMPPAIIPFIWLFIG